MMTWWCLMIIFEQGSHFPLCTGSSEWYGRACRKGFEESVEDGSSCHCCFGLYVWHLCNSTNWKFHQIASLFPKKRNPQADFLHVPLQNSRGWHLAFICYSIIEWKSPFPCWSPRWYCCANSLQGVRASRLKSVTAILIFILLNDINMEQFQKSIIFIWKLKRDRDRNRQRMIFHLLAHSFNTQKSQG